uniref:SRCR domain-containing protein n=1 Tax=Leptobrachium leishanense TaxID=445787 RepID=A0A8C5MLC4_9ANUR
MYIPRLSYKTLYAQLYNAILMFLPGIKFKFSLRPPSRSPVLLLVDGRTECEGRVEVMYWGEWGTVCDDGWGTANSAVVCKQLGCSNSSGDSHSFQISSFGAGSETVWLGDVKCTGAESALWECPHAIWGTNNCFQSNNIGVICGGEKPLFDPELRLFGGRTQCEGRVEVKHRGEWGTVCEKHWDNDDVAVVCRQLGCNNSHGENLSFQASSFKAGAGIIWLNEVECTGAESALWECPHAMWGLNNCNHDEDIGVICEAEEVRLVGGRTQCEGRVEVKHRGEWGTVCHDHWEMANTVVVCRQLGCSNSHRENLPFKSSAFGAGSGWIWLDDVNCTGDESALWECPHRVWGLSNCNHDEDIGVICDGE